MDEIASFGARREIDKAQGMLEDIVERAKPYATQSETLPWTPSAIPEWTSRYNSARIISDGGINGFNIQHQEEILFSDIQLDGASLYNSAKSGDHEGEIWQ